MFRRRFVLVLTTTLLLAPQYSGAAAIATSQIGFSGLQITPASGILEFADMDGDGRPDPWTLELFASAHDSLGGSSEEFVSLRSPAGQSLTAAIPWADGVGAGAANASPPDLAVQLSARSNVQVPGCGDQQADATGRSTLFNTIMITGGIGTADVVFSADLIGRLFASIDICGAFAVTETIFNLELDGIPILSFSDRVLAPPNGTAERPIDKTVTATVPLEFDIPYFLLIEADSESNAATVAEPPMMVLLMAGLLAFGVLRSSRGCAFARRW